MPTLNRRRSNVVSTSPTVLSGEAGAILKKGVCLRSTCYCRSEIIQTSVRHLLDIASTFGDVGRYPDRDPLLQHYLTHSRALEI